MEQTTLNNSKQVIIVSYNPIRLLSPEAETFLRSVTRVYDNAFVKPKAQQAVSLDDPHMLDVYTARHDASRIIVFLGKMDSGSGEIAYFFATTFSDVREKLHFMLCPHELAEKENLLRSLGFSDAQWSVFFDPEHRAGRQCNEWSALYGEAMRQTGE